MTEQQGDTLIQAVEAMHASTLHTLDLLQHALILQSVFLGMVITWAFFRSATRRNAADNSLR